MEETKENQADQLFDHDRLLPVRQVIFTAHILHDAQKAVGVERCLEAARHCRISVFELVLCDVFDGDHYVKLYHIEVLTPKYFLVLVSVDFIDLHFAGELSILIVDTNHSDIVGVKIATFHVSSLGTLEVAMD